MSVLKSVLQKKRLALLAGVALVAAADGTAYAQDQTTETVVVTGTRIPRPEYDLPNPTVAVTSDDIDHSGITNLGDYLQRIPALTGSLGTTFTTGFNTPASADGASLGGLNLLDLRNLGYVRTLVLVDGHRHVSESTGSAAIDIQSIPITLISRVEVSTGGASAIYGADAVSGVVNFVMKHDLEGINAKVQAGTSQDGGGASYLAAASVGHNFDDGKGNVSMTFEGTYDERLFFTQRSFTRVGGATFFVANPNAGSPGAPQFIPTNDAQFIFSAPTGAIDTDLDGLPDHLGNGQVFNLGTPISNSTAIGSSGQPFANVLQGDYLPNQRRYIGQIDGDYEFSHNLKVSAEFKYAHIDSKSFSTPPFDDFTAILPDNAFLPANVAALIAGNGAGFGILSEDYLALRRAEEIKRDTYRTVLDVSGDMPFWNDFITNFHYDLSYVYGQSDIDDIDVGNRVEDRFFAALDSVIGPSGQPTCRSNLNPAATPPDTFALLGIGSGFTDTDFFDPANFPATFTPGPNSGCVPFNPFDPNASQKAAIAFVTHNTHILGVITQQVVNGYVSGDFDQVKDWGMDGPLSIVLGGEYRKETSKSTPDAFTQQSLTFDSGTQPVAGSFDVKEFFAEASLPVVLDRPFAKELSFDAAVRQSSYSTAGDSTSWKVGGIFSPVDGLKFRATEAFAVRAPNIGELFAPQQRLFDNVTDPCTNSSVNSGTSFRVANCVALQAALGVPYTPGVTTLDTGATTPALVGGNPFLTPENARTVTFGVVLQPPGQDFVFTTDYYDITIRNAILAPSGQSVADECVDLSTINNPFCALITRAGPGSVFPGTISAITVTQLNVASFETDGIDFTGTWHKETKDWFGEDYGSLDFHLIGNYLDKLTFTALPGQAPVESDNTFQGGIDGQPAPRWQANLDTLWTFGKWQVDYNIDWYGAVLGSTRQAIESTPNLVAPQFVYLPDRFVQSVQVNYTIVPGWTVYGGINNLFYQKPSIGQQFLPVDPLGRFFYGGLRANVDFSDIPL